MIKNSTRVSERLIMELLPKSVVGMLRWRGSSNSKIIANKCQNAAVFVCAIKGLTGLKPAVTVNVLGALFCEIDRICQAHSCQGLPLLGPRFAILAGVPK